MSAVAESAQALLVRSEALGQSTVLTATGRLDATTYLSLRDTIIKAALDEPRAVLVDVSDLHVPQESAWAVFTSARWHVERWPDVPVVLVCHHGAGQRAVVRNGITRYVPVFATIELACHALAPAGPRPWRRRACVELPSHLTSLRRSRAFVGDSLNEWAMPRWIPVAQIVVTTFVENVLEHTHSAAFVRLETDGSTVTVAVADSSHAPASLRETSLVKGTPTGLVIVNALCRAWGNSPVPSGKTVWAVIGPEDRL